MDLQKEDIEEIFLRLPSIDNSIEVREEQIQLSKSIEECFRDGGTYIAEAGTGIGKTFAYVIPALRHILTQQGPVVIITGTINLQHQLANIDIPFIQSLLKTQVPVTILKGKSNYLCKSRLNNLVKEHTSSLELDITQDELLKIVNWSEKTVSGDKEELDITHKVWNKICTDEFQCKSRRCMKKNLDGCYYQLARKNALKVGIIISNYSFLTYHLRNLDSNNEGFLPNNAVYVLDEAHKFMEITRANLTDGFHLHDVFQTRESLFGQSGEITELRRQSVNVTQHVDLLFSKIDDQLQHIIQYLKKSAYPLIAQKRHELPSELQASQDINFSQLSHMSEVKEIFEILKSDFTTIFDCAVKIREQLEEGDSIFDSLNTLLDWTRMIVDTIAKFLDHSPNEETKNVRWCSFPNSNQKSSVTTPKDLVVGFYAAPLHVHNFLKSRFFDLVPAVCALSATLMINNKFDYWIKRNGAPQNSITQYFPSPFPYKKNVLLLIPQNAPEIARGNDEILLDYISDILPSCLDESNGRALILCTSKKAIRRISEELVTHNKKWNVLVQDNSIPIGQLSEKFRNTAQSVLIGTMSFWEGFDAPGDTLQFLVITKIPFPSPSQLFIKEEMDYVNHELSGNSFNEVYLPQAEIMLRQGFGRLMRSQHDYGVILITDSRILTKNYGKQLIASLPECNFITSSHSLPEEIRIHLQEHTP